MTSIRKVNGFSRGPAHAEAQALAQAQAQRNAIRMK